MSEESAKRRFENSIINKKEREHHQQEEEERNERGGFVVVVTPLLSSPDLKDFWGSRMAALSKSLRVMETSSTVFRDSLPSQIRAVNHCRGTFSSSSIRCPSGLIAVFEYSSRVNVSMTYHRKALDLSQNQALFSASSLSLAYARNGILPSLLPDRMTTNQLCRGSPFTLTHLFLPTFDPGLVCLVLVLERVRVVFSPAFEAGLVQFAAEAHLVAVLIFPGPVRSYAQPPGIIGDPEDEDEPEPRGHGSTN